MTITLQPIYTQILSSPASTVTFNNIPQNFTDLKIDYSVRSAQTAGSQFQNDNFFCRFNGDSTLNTNTIFYANPPSTIAPGRNVNSGSGQYIGTLPNAQAIANLFGNGSLYVPNYSSGFLKNNQYHTSAGTNSILSDSGYQILGAGLYRSNLPITSITFYAGSANLTAGSSITIYGIVRPGNRPKATGGQISTDGTYWYHTFRSTADFFPLEPMQVQVLAVGGGGGGASGDNGSEGGGGGGGGAVVTGLSDMLLPIGGYTASVGAGGTGSGGGTNWGANGGSSSFRGISAAGGGGGASGANGTLNAGFAGGSGGGGGRGGVGGVNIVYVGYSGGTAGSGGGGGGGAGAVGGNGSGATSGNGGIGTLSFSDWGYISGTGQFSGNFVYYSGGGAGGGAGVDTGTGGLGGGGNGGNAASSFVGYNGLANTGGGGGGGRGGSGSGKLGGNGGSGVVILRYRA